MSPVPGPARGRCLRGGPGAGRPGLGALQRCKRPRFSTLGAGRWHRARDRWRLPSIPGATAHRRECPPEPGILSRQQPLLGQAPGSRTPAAGELRDTQRVLPAPPPPPPRPAPVSLSSGPGCTQGPGAAARPGDRGLRAPGPSGARCGPSGPRSPGDGAPAAPSAGEGPGAAGEPAPTCGHPPRRGREGPGRHGAAGLRERGTNRARRRAARNRTEERAGARPAALGEPGRGRLRAGVRAARRPGRAPRGGNPLPLLPVPVRSHCAPRPSQPGPGRRRERARCLPRRQVPELGALGGAPHEAEALGPGEVRGRRRPPWKSPFPSSLYPTKRFEPIAPGGSRLCPAASPGLPRQGLPGHGVTVH